MTAEVSGLDLWREHTAHGYDGDNAEASESVDAPEPSWIVQRGTRGRCVRFAHLDPRGIAWEVSPSLATHYPAETLAQNLVDYLSGRFSSLRFRVVESSEALTSELRQR